MAMETLWLWIWPTLLERYEQTASELNSGGVSAEQDSQSGKTFVYYERKHFIAKQNVGVCQ